MHFCSSFLCICISVHQFFVYAFLGGGGDISKTEDKMSEFASLTVSMILCAVSMILELSAFGLNKKSLCTLSVIFFSVQASHETLSNSCSSLILCSVCWLINGLNTQSANKVTSRQSFLQAW